MSNLPKSKIKHSKITGPYPLLAVFLTVVEALLGFWLFQAVSEIERIFVGFFMTIILGGFLFVFTILSKEKEKRSGFKPQGFNDEIKPAHEETTQSEMDNLEPERIAAPDGSFSIQKPPSDWEIKVLTAGEWINENLKIEDPALIEKLFGLQSSNVNNKILVIDSNTTVSVIPTPGISEINNRKIPTALRTTIPMKLAIQTVDRAQPPFFIEQSFEHNIISNISAIISTHVLSLKNITKGILATTGREYITAEFSQNIEHANINGKDNQSVISNVTLIGIKGNIKDSILILNYPSFPDSIPNNQTIKNDFEVLQNLVNSFRPLKILNPEEYFESLRLDSIEGIKNTITISGEDMFLSEFVVLLMQLKNYDMNDPNNRLEAISLLKPFKIYADLIKFDDEQLNNLWESLDRAEKGDASDFKLLIGEVINELSEEIESDNNLLSSPE